MKCFKNIHMALSVGMAVVAVLVVGCTDSVIAPDVVQGEAPRTAMAAVSTSPVLTFPDLQPHDGESTLIRTKNGINYRLTTSGLEPGHAYTLWIVIWNAPEHCVDGCNGPDLFVEAAMPDMLYGTGLVVGGSGRATFSGRTKVGDASGSVQAPLGLAPNGLIYPYGAEVRLVVHHHGEKIPEFMPDMIQSVAGGCTDPGIPGPGVASPWNVFAGSPAYNQEYGRLGPNECLSILASVHEP